MKFFLNLKLIFGNKFLIIDIGIMAIKNKKVQLNNKRAGLLKFGAYEHMQRFYESGEMYFNTFDYFRHLEANGDGRADRDEYCFEHYSGERIKDFRIKIKPKKQSDKMIIFEGGKDLKELTLYSNQQEYSHLYSLSCIDLEWSIKNNFIISPLNFAKTKEYVVPIFNLVEFLERVKNKLKSLDLEVKTDYIEYVKKDSYSEKMGAFKKFSNYAYQNEFRIAVDFKTTTPEIINIGSLSDIAKHPQNKEDFFSSDCEIGYLLDGKLIKPKITNENIKEF